MDWELIWWCVAFFLGIAFVIYAAMQPTQLQVSEETIARIEKIRANGKKPLDKPKTI